MLVSDWWWESEQSATEVTHTPSGRGTWKLLLWALVGF